MLAGPRPITPSLRWYSSTVSWMSRLRSLLLCALRPIELTSSGWPLVAASYLISFSGSTVKNVPTARPMISPVAIAPAQPCRR